MTRSASPEDKRKSKEKKQKYKVPPDTWGSWCLYWKATSSDGKDGKQLARLTDLKKLENN